MYQVAFGGDFMKKKAKRVRVLKVVPLAPDKHIVELEIESEVPPPVVEPPVEIEAPQEATHPFLKWLKDRW
jgi:hypothetical protein